MPTMDEVQRALQRCLVAEPPEDFRLSPDASRLTTVYGEMVYWKESDRPLEGFSPKQQAAFERWAWRD